MPSPLHHGENEFDQNVRYFTAKNYYYLRVFGIIKTIQIESTPSKKGIQNKPEAVPLNKKKPYTHSAGLIPISFPSNPLFLLDVVAVTTSLFPFKSLTHCTFAGFFTLLLV